MGFVIVKRFRVKSDTVYARFIGLLIQYNDYSVNIIVIKSGPTR